jgi:hypothetical protein
MRNKINPIFILVVVAALVAIIENSTWAAAPQASLRLPAIISDQAVLQADVPVRVWGWAKPGEFVLVNFQRPDGGGSVENNAGLPLRPFRTDGPAYSPSGAAIPATQPASAAEPGAAKPNTLTVAEKAAGWRLLFDGKTTAGWRGFKKSECPDGWKVIDGTLDRVSKSGDIITVDQFDSFELVLDWRISKAGNSGVMYHVVEEEDRAARSGPECQLLDNVNGEDRQLAGWCYGLYQPPIDPKTGQPLDTTRPFGQWNTLRILIHGPHVEHWMNGTKYIEYELWSDD